MFSIYGLTVKKRLLEIGMSQKELSEMLGISKANMSMILSGKRKGWKYREEIDYILGNTKSRRVV